MLSTPVGRFRVLAFVEGVSFLVLLLIAMPIKYVEALGKNPTPVVYVGWVHGGLHAGHWGRYRHRPDPDHNPAVVAGRLHREVRPGHRDVHQSAVYLAGHQGAESGGDDRESGAHRMDGCGLHRQLHARVRLEFRQCRCADDESLVKS